MMKRKGVVFNLGSPEEKELYDFCLERSPKNFSGFIKKALLLYMKGTGVPEPKMHEDNFNQGAEERHVEEESDLMSAII
jgi:hypothetical protein